MRQQCVPSNPKMASCRGSCHEAAAVKLIEPVSILAPSTGRGVSGRQVSPSAAQGTAMLLLVFAVRRTLLSGAGQRVCSQVTAQLSLCSACGWAMPKGVLPAQLAGVLVILMM